MFIAIGLVLPKVDTSYTIGIRTPWTLSNRNNWRMVHRLGGRLFIGAGILLFGCAGFNHTPIFCLPLFFAIINVIVLVFANADPKNKHLTTFPVAIIASLIPFITVGTMLMVDVLALGYRVQITTVVMFHSKSIRT
ncbi:SdpI family protein [Weissella confusa]|uniref:SdpI family protein n=1 Tax=Weissella confusa TaxID=1583 RepID=A0A923NHE7_WEICO|nr:SdpI family protein [Weissella confusa]